MSKDTYIPLHSEETQKPDEGATLFTTPIEGEIKIDLVEIFDGNDDKVSETEL